MKLLQAVLLFVLGCGVAAAQLRTIPADAKRGTLRHVQGMLVEIDGARTMLAPGAQIRSPTNTIVLPAAVPPDTAVKYLSDSAGQVKQVWILSPQEAARP